jgi:hypothetical protein
MKITLYHDPYDCIVRIKVSPEGRYLGLAPVISSGGEDWRVWIANPCTSAAVICLASIKADRITRALIRAVIAAACRAGMRATSGAGRALEQFAEKMISRREVSRCELVYRLIALTMAR